MRASRGSTWRKSSTRTLREISAIAPASSTPVGPAADDGERQQGAPPGRVRRAVRFLECEQDAAANLERVLEALQPGGPRLPGLVAEVGVPGAGSDHERVVGQPAAVGERHLAALRVDRQGLGQDDVGVLLAPQNRSDGVGDVGGGERGGRHLIQERLEEIVIAPIHDGDANRGAGEALHGLEPAETGSHDDDVRTTICGHWSPDHPPPRGTGPRSRTEGRSGPGRSVMEWRGFVLVRRGRAVERR